MTTEHNQLGVAMIGCGNAGEWYHVPALRSLPDAFEIRAIVDPSAGARNRVRDLLGLPDDRCFESVEAALELDDIDVVDVCTPPRFRREVVEAAIAAGRHVIAEKPLSTCLADIDRMIAARDRHGVTVATIHNHLHLPDISILREVASSGEIGEVEVLVLCRLGLEDLPGTPDYEPDWRHRAEAGGGVLMDFLHYAYVMETLLGAPVERIAGHVIRDGAVERTAVCLLETAGSVGTLHAGWGVGVESTELRGSRGYALVRDGRVEIGTADGTRTVALPVPEPDFSDTFVPVFADVHRAIAQGSPAATLEDGKRALGVVLGAYKAAASRSSVELPLSPSDPLYTDGLAALSWGTPTDALSPAG